MPDGSTGGIKKAHERRQVFIVTHNPNLAVVCDADQVIYAKMNKASGNAITYKNGALENPSLSQYVTDVLEGTRWALGVRDAKYSGIHAPFVSKIDCSENCSDRVSSCIHSAPIRHSAAAALNADF
jgi:hypothetical protein